MEAMKNITVRAALGKIMSRCDGAIAQDGQGFSKFDRPIVENLLSQQMTKGQTEFGAKICVKYREQLAAMGINIDAIDVTAEREKSPIEKENQNHRVEVDSNGEVNIRLVWGGDKFYEIKDKVSRIAKYNAFSKSWYVYQDQINSIPKILENYNGLIEFSDGYKTLLENFKKEDCEREQRKIASEKETSNLELKKFSGIKSTGGKILPFQRAGIEYGVAVNSILFADEMGLGKTVQAIGVVVEKDAFPCLVICPASLKLNWGNEIKMWSHNSSVVLNSKMEIDIDKDFVIINYDIVHKWFIDIEEIRNEKGRLLRKEYKVNRLFNEIGFKSIIVDESHMMKNRKARRTKAVKVIGKEIPLKILATGTPILNRPFELIEQLKFLGKFDEISGGGKYSFFNFAKRYCGAVKGAWGWDFSGATNLEELQQKLRSVCMVRRSKENVLKDLPSKSRNTVFIPFKNKARYSQRLKELMEFLDQEVNEARQLVEIEKLKQLVVEEKMEAAVEWIENFLETGESLVVFISHHKTKEMLLEKFPKASVLMGDNTIEERQEAIEFFQNKKTNLFVGSIKAAGVGITLTASSTVAFLEQEWTSALHDQAEDRCHRIGQRGNVNCFYLLAKGTVDEDINELLEKKRQILANTLDGQDFDIGKELIKRMKKTS